MPTELLISAQTAEATSDAFVFVGESAYPDHILCPGLGVGETAKLQVKVGATWHDYYQDGSLQQCDDTNSGFLIAGPGTYRVVKSITSSAIAVVRDINPAGTPFGPSVYYVAQDDAGRGDGVDAANAMSLASFHVNNFIPGDVVRFSGEFTETITPPTSGDDDGLVSYIGLDASINVSSGNCLDLRSLSYASVSGFTLGSTANASMIDINTSDDAAERHLTLSELTLESYALNAGVQAIKGAGQHITIEDCDIRTSGAGIYLLGHNNTIRRNYVDAAVYDQRTNFAEPFDFEFESDAAWIAYGNADGAGLFLNGWTIEDGQLVRGSGTGSYIGQPIAGWAEGGANFVVGDLVVIEVNVTETNKSGYLRVAFAGKSVDILSATAGYTTGVKYLFAVVQNATGQFRFTAASGWNGKLGYVRLYRALSTSFPIQIGTPTGDLVENNEVILRAGSQKNGIIATAGTDSPSGAFTVKGNVVTCHGSGIDGGIYLNTEGGLAYGNTVELTGGFTVGEVEGGTSDDHQGNMYTLYATKANTNFCGNVAVGGKQGLRGGGVLGQVIVNNTFVGCADYGFYGTHTAATDRVVANNLFVDCGIGIARASAVPEIGHNGFWGCGENVVDGSLNPVDPAANSVVVNPYLSDDYTVNTRALWSAGTPIAGTYDFSGKEASARIGAK